MARPAAPDTFAREILDRTVSDEMRDSFVPYALSVTTARAIPDVRDGLKPVQRRILYAMDDMGLRPGAARRKSANVVGRVMADLHPHGDSAIYEAMARMAQDFAMSVTLVDPQGNFGSLDDPPAAYRYTEARLAQAAVALIGEIDEDTVDFVASYDGRSSEPVCLPAALPNLLVNGASGIAVGMATSMPPHNLREVHRVIELVMTKRRPRPTIDDLMELLPGPDFPAGGIVIDDGSLRDAYRTGRGTFRVRARAAVEPLTARRQAIVITELPYMVGPERVLGRIQELLRAGRLGGVADVKNLSDRSHGLRLVVECRAEADPYAVLGQLYRLTPLEEGFSINNVALVNGVPTTLGLHELCQHYIDHRLDVVVRRTEFRLGKARERAHIVEGLLIALDAIDRVIAIIRGSGDVPEARQRLVDELALSEIQANHILDMQLRRLTALEITKLREELVQLRQRIAEYERILGSEQRRRTLVLAELAEVAAEHGVDRRSTIVSADAVPAYEPPPAVEGDEQGRLDFDDTAVVVTLATSGLLGRAPAEDAHRAKPGRHDVIASSVVASAGSQVYGITDRGRLLAVLAADVPEVAGRSRGASVSEMLALGRGERLVGLVGDPTVPVAIFTRTGVVKRLDPGGLGSTRNGNTVIALRDGDRVVAAFSAPDGGEVVLVTSDGQALRTAADGISVQGPGAAGVGGIRLKEGASVVGAGPVEFGTVVWTGTGDAAKTTDVAEIPAKGRSTAGVRIVRLRPDEPPVSGVYIGPADVAAFVAGAEGRSEATPVELVLQPTRRDGTTHPVRPAVIAIGRARS